MEVSVDLDMSSFVAVVEPKIWIDWGKERMGGEKLEQPLQLFSYEFCKKKKKKGREGE